MASGHSHNLALSCSVLALGLCAADNAAAQEVDWVKIYVGGHIGADIDLTDVNFGDFTQIDPTEFFGSFAGATGSSLGGPFTQDNESSIIGGLLAGWNFYQSGNIVIGVESDLSFTGANTSAIAANRSVFLGVGGSDLAIFDETRELNVDVEWKATLRGRAGLVALPNFLLFLTGGLAVGDIEAKQTTTLVGTHFTGPPFTFPFASFTSVNEGTDSNIHVGWSAGGGADMKLFDGVTARLEALYFDLGSETYDFGAAGTTSIDVDEVVVRAAFTIDLN